MRKNIFLGLSMVLAVLAGTMAYAQEFVNSKVYFIGIGVEKCADGTPGKPNAEADVRAVSKRTHKDVDGTGTISYIHSDGTNNVLATASKTYDYFLFNDNATKEKIDSLFAEVAKKAQPHDIFYFYIAARSSGDQGGFVVPMSSAEKKKLGKSAAATRSILDVKRLNEIFSIIPCQNQMIVIDGTMWSENHGTLLPLFFQSDGNKNQVVIAPNDEDRIDSSYAYTDGSQTNQISLLPLVICKAKKSLLTVFKKSQEVLDDVGMSLGNAYMNITGEEKRFPRLFASWKMNNAGPLPVAKANPAPAPQQKPEPESPSKAVAANDKQKNADSKSDPSKTPPAAKDRGVQVDLNTVAEEVGEIQHFALIIANQNYQNNNVWGNLTNPINDARSLDSVLRTMYGYKTQLIIDAPLDTMKKAFDNLLKRKFNPNTQVLVYYAGHGAFDTARADGIGYMVPVDGGVPEVDDEAANALAYDVLETRLKRLTSKHVLFMVDACYSGSFDRALVERIGESAPMPEQQASRASVQEQIVSSMTSYSRCYLSSGKLTTVADGTKSAGHSPFMAKVLKVLYDGNKKKAITSFQMLVYELQQTNGVNPHYKTFGGQGDAGNYIFIPSSLLKQKN